MGFWIYFTDDHAEYYDSDSCKLIILGKSPIKIVDNSKKIFDFLVENRKITMSRDKILGHIYGIDYLAQDVNDTRSPVDSAIRKLRGKLDKYSYVIETNSGVGYVYIGPEPTPKDSSLLNDSKTESDQNRGLSQNKPDFSNKNICSSSENNVAPKTLSVERVNYTMSNFRTALNILIEANDISSINNARAYIRETIRSYIFKVAIDFESSDGDDWKSEVDRHTWLLHKEIYSTQNEIMTRNQEQMIIDTKMRILDNIRDFHILTIFLSVQLLQERDALERTADSIGKEIISSRINKINSNYQFARERESTAEASVDNMIDSYIMGGPTDTPII